MARFGDLQGRAATSVQRVLSTGSMTACYQRCEHHPAPSSWKTSPWSEGCSGTEARDWSAEATRVKASLDEEVHRASCTREAKLLASLQRLEAGSAAFDSEDDDLGASHASLSLDTLKLQAGRAASRLSTAVATRKHRALYQSQQDSELENEITTIPVSPWEQATRAQNIKAALDAEVRGKQASLPEACPREARLLASLASCSNQQRLSTEQIQQSTVDVSVKQHQKFGERVGASLQWVSSGLAARKERALYSNHVDDAEWDQESVRSLPSSPGFGPASPADAAGVRAILDAKLNQDTWPAWPQTASTEGESGWPMAADASSPWSPWNQDCKQPWSLPASEKEQPLLTDVAKLNSEDLQALLRKISQCRPDDVRAALGATTSDASTADASSSETSSELDLPMSPNSAARSSPWPLPTLLGSRSLRFGGKRLEQHEEHIAAPLW